MVALWSVSRVGLLATDAPVLAAGELTPGFAVAGGVVVVLGVLLAVWTEGIVRLLWARRTDAPRGEQEPPDWFTRLLRALGAAFAAVAGLALVLDWVGYAGL